MRIPRTATVALAGLTALAWLLVAALGATNQAATTMGFIPARLSGLVDLTPAVPTLLTPLSSTLVHGGFVHLAFNLLMLLWCGTAVERALGRGALLILYGIGAYAAAIAQWLADPGSIVPVIGASGAISAVIGAFALSFGETRRITASPPERRSWILMPVSC